MYWVDIPLGIYLLLIGIIGVFGLQAKGAEYVIPWAALIAGVVLLFRVWRLGYPRPTP